MQTWLWLGATIGALAVSIGLARSRTEEATVAIVGLFVFSLVLASVATTMVQRRADAALAAFSRPVDVPLVLLLSAAFLAFCFSVFLWFFAEKSYGIFVGLWVPSILALTTVVLLTRRPPAASESRAVVREDHTGMQGLGPVEEMNNAHAPGIQRETRNGGGPGHTPTSSPGIVR